jgi:hypothetical protein
MDDIIQQQIYSHFRIMEDIRNRKKPVSKFRPIRKKQNGDKTVLCNNCKEKILKINARKSIRGNKSYNLCVDCWLRIS